MRTYNLKKWIIFFLMCIGPLTLEAHDFEVDGILYSEITDNEVEVAWKKDYSGIINIPETIYWNNKTYTVTGIGEWAIQSQSITEVTLPNTIKYISAHACFMNSGIKAINLPNSIVSIGEEVFYDCTSLTSITLPESLKTIGDRVFYGCSSLSEVRLPDSLIAVSKECFRECVSLSNISLPNSIKTIQAYSFYGCKSLTAIELPIFLDSISDYAFSGCDLHSVTIPSSVSFVGRRPFSGQNLSSIIVEDGNPNYDSRNNCNAIINSSTNTLINGCKTSTIPQSVSTIGWGAFENCEFNCIFIPTSVHTIGEYAFSRCNNLRSIILPQVSNIEEHAFDGCKNLLSVTMSKNTHYIGRNAFGQCLSLRSIKLPNTLSNDYWGFGYGAFEGCSGLVTVVSDIEDPNKMSSDLHPFSSINSNAVLYVPVGCLDNYQHRGWYTDAFAFITENTKTFNVKITSNGGRTVLTSESIHEIIENETKNIKVSCGMDFLLEVQNDDNCCTTTLRINNKDVASNLLNNTFAIGCLGEDIEVEIVFGTNINEFTIDGVTFTILSRSDDTVKITSVRKAGSVSIQPNITYGGRKWLITEIGEEAFKNNTGLISVMFPSSITRTGNNLFTGCLQLSAIQWNCSARLTDAVMGTVTNPNLLLYVSNRGLAPSTINNVVVNGTAESIRLSDAVSGNNFFCPIEFTAKEISYTHRFGMTSGRGTCQGWETLVLPFDVQEVKQGSTVLSSFVTWSGDRWTRPFWLYGMTNAGFRSTGSIRANTPYIISMPNNTSYDAEWNISGDVTFSATQAKVYATTQLTTAKYNGKTFTPCYTERPSGGQVYALNVNNLLGNHANGYAEGSVFVNAPARTVHPFEAYLETQTASAKTAFSIFEDMTEETPTGMLTKKAVYNLSGQLVKLANATSAEEAIDGLPAGIYIVDGKKVVRATP